MATRTVARTEKNYRTINGVRVSDDNRIRAYKRYVAHWTVEVDGVVIGHYRTRLFYALATAEHYIKSGDATLIPEPEVWYEPLPPITSYTVIPPTGAKYVDGKWVVSKEQMLQAALIRSGNAIGSYSEWIDEETGEKRTLRGIEYGAEPVADDFPGACQPWKPNGKR